MKQIRKHLFETNSSSVHTITICTEDEFKKFQNNKLGLDFEDELIPLPKIDPQKMDAVKNNYTETHDLYKKHHIYNPEYSMTWDELSEQDKTMYYYDSQNIETSRRFYDTYYFETYEEHFITPSGDKMVAFGKYGHD